ncbi:CDP-diacylglycerol--glycerol-3-phosphate 3-phosphatidyltransferase [Lachnotalea glycerini]|uniref:CDP-diacylglycerol--glycerol-3-phosphate 3-phosphatidyltransferase n=1 Tax=Lachnotalea glycerini TaxID=1763509 RepID=A0A318EU51_9FIRM|nr:CDP-alcohol phosphatidyltransferase family protein [Lachnotalea glycerini]PXV96050.1 CDP-diacylglycerol--glycerol-3-phosphate 3-phosphatidyltransferase [Lachnotalea glycerini]
MFSKIPDVLTILRIILSLVILIIKPLSILFFVLYLICGLGDMLDGFLARKMGAESEHGAALDSLADFVLIAVLMYVFFPYLDRMEYMILWVIGIFAIRIGGLFVGFMKHHTLAFLHTYANKATGFLLFCFPLLYVIFGMPITCTLLCSIASISAIEELLIQIKAKTLNRNISSIFKINQNELK